MTLYEILGSVETGFIFALVAMGAFITFKVLDFPDLTVEGSFPLGAAVCATLMVDGGVNAWVAVFIAGLVGFVAGYVTAFLNVRWGILHILSGILVAISLYSINLRIMSGPNKPLLGVDSVFTSVEWTGIPFYILTPLVLGVFVLFGLLLLNLFLATGHGLSMRATGTNPHMSEANGINIGRMKLMGVSLANFLTAIAGALFAQSFGAADAYMGIGVIITGLASVIVGMSILPSSTILKALLACAAGAILYRLAVALALNADFIGLAASDVQLVTAIIVVFALVAQNRGLGLKSLLRRGDDK